MDSYKILGIPRNSTTKEIRARYLSLARQYHPDKNNGTTTKKFQEIEAAYRNITEIKKKTTQSPKPPPPKPPPPKPPKPPPPPPPPQPKFKKGQSLDDFLSDLINDGKKKLGKKKDKWS